MLSHVGFILIVCAASPGLDLPWVAVVAAAACPGPGSVPDQAGPLLIPAAVAAVEPAVEEEPAVAGPAAAAAAVELVGLAAVVGKKMTIKSLFSMYIYKKN